MSTDLNKLRVAVFCAEGFEEVEALSVVDILYRAQIPCDIVSITPELQVVSSHKVTVVCNASVCDSKFSFDAYDMLVLPGGLPGAHNLRACVPLCDAISRFAADTGKAIAAICAAPYVFGELGVLKGVHATSHPNFHAKIAADGAILETSSAVVTDGSIITGQGAAAALDFGLAIVRYYATPELAQEIAEKIVR